MPEDKISELIEGMTSGDCPFCGNDPYHYVDNGLGMERVAVVCCDYGIALFQHGDEHLSRVAGERYRAADALIRQRDEISALRAERSKREG